MGETTAEKIARYIGEKNYLAAYMTVKNGGLTEDEKIETTGRLVTKILDDLSLDSIKKNPERAVYLRSLLAWIFRDVPGLSSLYREQLRGVQDGGDPMMTLYKNLRVLNDVATGKKSFAEGVEESVDAVRRGFEDAPHGDVSDSMKGFAEKAEDGVRRGFQQFTEFFDTITESARRQNAARDNAERDADTTDAPHESSADDDGIRVDIVDEDGETR